MSPQVAGNTWRSKVRAWVESTNQHRQLHVLNFATAAEQCKATFPRSLFVVVVGYVVPSLAVWIVKNAVRDAATSLGVSLTSGELDLIANLLVAAIVS